MPLIEALGSSYHWRERGVEHLTGSSPAAVSRSCILAGFWPRPLLPRSRIIVITSENFDGEWIRGSSGASVRHGGDRPRVEAPVPSSSGATWRPAAAAFTVDGPADRRGGAGRRGVARATGNPLILPFHIESSSHWTLKSWDRHQIRNRAAKWRW
jgi:lysophospholipid acyltransferase (LPLAT)-like uncharacterized protein